MNQEPTSSSAVSLKELFEEVKGPQKDVTPEEDDLAISMIRAIAENTAEILDLYEEDDIAIAKAVVLGKLEGLELALTVLRELKG